MLGLLNHSNLSLASSRPPSIISLPTTASSNTEAGIGTLSGRAVYAVGEAALRGFENLAIRRKLRIISSTFPHDNAIVTKNMEAIYGDVLELSRPGLYRLQVRKQALRVLIIQIGSRQTSLLLRCLVKWPTVEVALLLSGIMACMPAQWLPPKTVSNDVYAELMEAYISSMNTGTYKGEYHPASPLIDFVAELARIDYQAVLDSGFLDMLLCMYVCNFSNGETVFSSAQRLISNIGSDRRSMLEACTAVLEKLCQQANALVVVSAHPVYILWPKTSALRILYVQRSNQRYLQWREMESVIVARRLATIPELLQLLMPEDESDLNQLADACVDIIEFSRETLYGPNVSQDALTLIHKCIELRGAYWDALSRSLSDISQADSQHIFCRLILRASPAYEDQLHDISSVQVSTVIANALALYRDEGYFTGNARPVKAIATDLVDTLPWVEAKYDPTQCCIGCTRDAVLHRVMEWATSFGDDRPRIFWLLGMAGEGKSAIAASVAKWMEHSQQCLGASFCFSSQSMDRDNPDFLFSTISHQLSTRFPLVRQFINEVLRQDPDITKASLFNQFVALLLKPLQSTAWSFYRSGPLVLVLDGLDECGSDSTRSSIRSIFRSLHQLPAFVKVFVTSRPERDLQGLFNSMDSQVDRYDLSDIPRAIVDCDVQAFIEARMSAILNARRELQDEVGPDESTYRALVTRSDGSFLWVSRAMDFIGFDYSGRLETLCNSETDDEFRGLEDIYIHVLETAYPHDASATSLRQFHDHVGTIITLKQVASPDVLGVLYITISQEAIEVVSRLRPIMTITGPNHDTPGTVRVIHPSFADFLSSIRCPSRFCIDVRGIHAKCARGSLVRMHTRLKRDFCGILDESMLNAEVRGLEAKLRLNLTDDLRYACRFWSYHVSQSPEDDDEIYELVKSFFCEDVRKWLEILSLLGILDHVHDCLELSRIWILSRDNDDGLATLISDIQLSINNSLPRLVLQAAYSYIFTITLSPESTIEVSYSVALGGPSPVISEGKTDATLNVALESAWTDGPQATEPDKRTNRLSASSDLITAPTLRPSAAKESPRKVWSQGSEDTSDVDSFYSATSDNRSLLVDKFDIES